ncbi:MAG: hypothetical protein JXR77_10835, partial [Lentisphaeria bacterium]|nr:hypothetical protein [Lentisphaeria bacterium]
DQTQIPLPFSRVDLAIGPLLRIDRADGEAVDRLRQALLAVTDDRRKGAVAGNRDAPVQQ